MQNYTEAKLKNQAMQNFSKPYLSDTMQQRMCDCGSWLDFIADFSEEKKKLMAANFCKWRFCPMCAWRRARRDAQRLSVLMDYINKEHRKEFIFLTLTVPNVPEDALRDKITGMNAAFNRLKTTKAWKAIDKGHIRKLEITYNPVRDDYHPHFHVVIAVNVGYFKGGAYRKQELWLQAWRDAMRDQSITQVDVRRIRRAEANGELASYDVDEFAKYAAKDADYTKNANVFDAFYNALKGRQVLTYSGLFATANAMYKADELAEYIAADTTAYYWQLVYAWAGKDKKYTKEKHRPLDAMDKLLLERRGITTEAAD